MEFFWHCHQLKDIDAGFVSESLDELFELLKKPPVEVNFRCQPLIKDYAIEAEKILSIIPVKSSVPFSIAYFRKFRELFRGIENHRLLIYCDRGSEIAKAAKTQCCHAYWGFCSEPPFIAAVYERGNKYILWHELLHLLGVDDCYGHTSLYKEAKCGLSNCLMRYAPDQNTVGDWPFLCKTSIGKIKKFVKDHSL